MRLKMSKKILSYLVIVLAIIITPVLLAGCTAAGQAATQTQTSAAAKENNTSSTSSGTAGSPNEILIESNAFKPDTLAIKIGDTVTWINKDSYSHTVKGKNGEFDSGDIASGAKYSFTFEKEGNIDYICGIHTFMTGKIVVTK
jgi:plastocyanin